MIKKNTVIASVVLITLAVLSTLIGVYFYFRNDCFRHDMSIVLGWFVVSCVLMIIGGLVLRNNIKPWYSLPLSYSIILIVGYSVMWGLGKGQDEWEAFCHQSDYAKENNSLNSTSSNPSASHSVIGEYEVIDTSNDTWILILNEDETVNLHVKNGREFYGTWTSYIDDIIWIQIPFDDAPNGPNIKGDMTQKSSLFIRDGFIYGDGTASKSKNPRMRLSITKVK